MPVVTPSSGEITRIKWADEIEQIICREEVGATIFVTGTRIVKGPQCRWLMYWGVGSEVSNYNCMQVAKWLATYDDPIVIY